MSQSTLSSGVRELEAVLGGPLVDRGARSFRLTPLGEAAFTRAQDILAAAEALVSMAKDANEPLVGAFRLGVIPTIGPFVLPKVLPLLKTRYPKLELFLREDLTANLVDRLMSGALDAIVIAYPYGAPGLESQIIADDPFYYACPGDWEVASPVDLEVCDLDKLLLLEDGHCLRDHALAVCGGGGRNAFGATSLLTLLQMVDNGLGATLVPKMAVDSGLGAGLNIATYPLKDSSAGRQVGVAWRRGAGVRVDAEALSELIRAAVN